MSEATQRDTAEVIEWYKKYDTIAELGFDPDGMCQKICRTARNVGPGAPSALSSQINTPEQFRVHKISDIKRGMVMYFDDPRDSNPYGHIVTVMGRIRDADPDDLGGIVVRTNSVQSNRVVPVRADYFPKWWGDQFVFAGVWINGEPFYDLLEDKPGKKPPKKREAPNVKEAIGNIETTIDLIDKAIEAHEKKENARYVRALRRDRMAAVKSLDALKDTYQKMRGGN